MSEERRWGSSWHVRSLRCAVDAVLAGGAIVRVSSCRAVASSRGRNSCPGTGREAGDRHVTVREGEEEMTGTTILEPHYTAPSIEGVVSH